MYAPHQHWVATVTFPSTGVTRKWFRSTVDEITSVLEAFDGMGLRTTLKRVPQGAYVPPTTQHIARLDGPDPTFGP